MARKLSHYLLDYKAGNIEDAVKNILINFFKNSSKILSESDLEKFEIDTNN